MASCNTVIRRAILALAVVVFLGNIMMWIVMPTDTYYEKWVPHIMADTNSTFFGIQGPIMLDFTFPILFIAVLGCIYLHLGKKTSSDQSKIGSKNGAQKPESLKRPMIVKGLGIVSLTELTLFSMFIALDIWYFSYYVRYWFKQVPILQMTRHEQVWQTKLDRVAISFGLAGNLCLTFLFYPVTRGSSILPMLGLTSEGGIKYHIWIGNMALALFTIHGSLYITYWTLTHRLSEMLKWDTHYVSNVAGEIGLLCGLALWMTTYPNIRRKMFELFFYTHYLYIPFMIFFILHISMGFACIMLPGFYLFIIDRYLRFLQSRQNVQLVSARVLSCETVELNFSKSRALNYSPTSIMFINVPSISKLQWHPFTVTSNSNLEPDRMSVVIKCEGNWTKKLFDVISSNDHRRLQVSVEGPYGPAATNFLRCDILVLVSGGSGITPFISIIRELIYLTSTAQSQNIPKIKLISMFKNSSNLSILDLILPISGIPSSQHSCANIDLQIEAYITREKGHPKDKTNAPQIVSFKPNPSDEPIYPTLGPNSWLWLAAIISSSFVMFLILLGVYSQYVVYPIDQNTNKLYSYPKKALMNMLFIFSSIVLTSTGVFLWNKKRNSSDTKQILNMEESVNSRASFIEDERELESVPQQSVIKSINVHYGKRPDLQSILLESKGTRVGVLASGPKRMRHDVAAICSSGLADNLHFESISFSW